MVRRLLVLFGIVEFLFPRRVINVAEWIALENPGDPELRVWTVPMARLEALAYLAFVLRGDASAPLISRLFGLFGAFAFLFPRRCMALGTRLAYRNADDCEWKSWVEPATRVVGLFYVFLAVAGRLPEGWSGSGEDVQQVDEGVVA